MHAAQLVMSAVINSCHNAGTYAEYATIKSSLLARMPDNVSFDQAAALPLVSLTAMQVGTRGLLYVLHICVLGVGAAAVATILYHIFTFFVLGTQQGGQQTLTRTYHALNR